MLDLWTLGSIAITLTFAGILIVGIGSAISESFLENWEDGPAMRMAKVGACGVGFVVVMVVAMSLLENDTSPTDNPDGAHRGWDHTGP